MSARLIGELAEWLQSPIAQDLTQAERNILWTVTERTEETHRRMLRHRTDTQTLHERISRTCGLSIETGALQKAFNRLAARGLEVRVQFGTDKAGRPLYACKGRSMEFRLPELPPSYTIPERVDEVPPFEEQRAEPRPPSWPPPPVDNPAPSHLGWAAKGRFSSTHTDQRVDDIPERVDEVPGRVDEVPPLSPSVPSGPSTTKTFPSDGLRPSPAEVEGTDDAEQPLPDIDQDQYFAAMQTLTALPDNGAFVLARAATNLPDADRRTHVIHAAALAARIPA